MCVWITTFDAPLSQGLDDGVKSIYYARCRSQELNQFSKGLLVNRMHLNANTAPAKGLCAFVRATMSFDDQVHPGEESA